MNSETVTSWHHSCRLVSAHLFPHGLSLESLSPLAEVLAPQGRCSGPCRLPPGPRVGMAIA